MNEEVELAVVKKSMGKFINFLETKPDRIAPGAFGDKPISVPVTYEFDRSNKEFPKAYSALPDSQERTLERFYMADGWWYSVESIELVEEGVISTGWFVPENHV